MSPALLIFGDLSGVGTTCFEAEGRWCFIGSFFRETGRRQEKSPGHACASPPLLRKTKFVSARAVFHSRPSRGMQNVTNCMENSPVDFRVCSPSQENISRFSRQESSGICQKAGSKNAGQ
jgi:hypothetical protein